MEVAIGNWELRITNYELRITNYELRITNYGLWIMDYGLWIGKLSESGFTGLGDGQDWGITNWELGINNVLNRI